MDHTVIWMSNTNMKNCFLIGNNNPFTLDKNCILNRSPKLFLTRFAVAKNKTIQVIQLKRQYSGFSHTNRAFLSTRSTRRASAIESIIPLPRTEMRCVTIPRLKFKLDISIYEFVTQPRPENLIFIETPDRVQEV